MVCAVFGACYLSVGSSPVIVCRLGTFLPPSKLEREKKVWRSSCMQVGAFTRAGHSVSLWLASHMTGDNPFTVEGFDHSVFTESQTVMAGVGFSTGDAGFWPVSSARSLAAYQVTVSIRFP